jgi:hypothetical protein
MATTKASNPGTAPIELQPLNARLIAIQAAASVQTGVATKFWMELVAYPHGSARSLWLFVGGQWRHLDNPSPSIESSVQSAFCNCPDKLEVAVWYSNDVIVGLVVRSK